MNRCPRPILALALLLVPLAPARAADTGTPPPAAVGLDLAGMDPAVAPGEDFFLHANGAWLKATEIPADRGGVGVFNDLAELTSTRTAELIRQAGQGQPPAGSNARRVADYYAAFMDEAGIEKRGLAPLQPALDRIAALADRTALARELGAGLRADVDAFNATNFYTDRLFGLWVAQDLVEPGRYSAFLLQGGLDLPDRAYYLDPSPRMAEIRAKLQAHVAAMLKLAGLSEAEARAARVVELERRMAEAHATRAESEEVKSGLNHWPRTAFAERAPGLDWQAYFDAAGLGKQDLFVVWQPAAVTGLSALVASQPLETWKDYLVFHAVDRAAPFLPRAFGDERFAFHATALAGIPQQRERWKRAVEATNQALGDAVGQLYVERFFPPASQARIEGMVQNLIRAFGQRIDRLEWMSPATRERAKAKLAVLKVGVGHTRQWRDDAGLEIRADDAFGNAQRAGLHDYRLELAKLGRPVDRGEWVMTPQTVNAVNLPAMNAMNFPAAILQPPFFDPQRPLAMDYGAIGAVIGHEVSHSFDDQGAQFDDQGRLRNWWTDDDKAHFEAAAERLVKQYSEYRPFPDAAVDGRLTLSENIADVAGLAAAFDAWKLSLEGRPAPVVAGLSGEQQFFLSFAQSWRQKSREASQRQQLLTNAHAPGRYRALTVRNVDPWYEAFDVKPGQALFLPPAERVRIW